MIIQQKYVLFVALPLVKGGYIVIDAEDIEFIKDDPKKDEPATVIFKLRSDDGSIYRLSGTAQDMLAEIHEQRISQLHSLSLASKAQ